MKFVYPIAELAYAAGIIDGEGTVSIRKKTGGGHPGRKIELKLYHTLVVSMSNTDPRIIDWFGKRWGGHVGIKRYETERYKTLYRWVIGGRKAELFLRSIRPYLIIKAEHADLAFALRRTMVGRGGKLTPELEDRRDNIHSKIARLNRRGV